MFSVLPDKLRLADQYCQGDIEGYSLFWIRESGTHIEYEHIVDHDGFGFYFDNQDEAWKADDDFGAVKPGWDYSTVLPVSIKV